MDPNAFSVCVCGKFYDRRKKKKRRKGCGYGNLLVVGALPPIVLVGYYRYGSRAHHSAQGWVTSCLHCDVGICVRTKPN